MNLETKPVLFSEQSLGGPAVGIVELNRPKALNSLNLEIVELMAERLKEWADDKNIACLVIKGCGEKAFCAGGDVKSVVVHTKEDGNTDYAHNFFANEYKVDYLIHAFPKPTVVLAHGFTMGGGMGLMMGCDFRVTFDNTVIAMPETKIGFYPDVAASYFLHRLKQPVAKTLALSGVTMKGADILWAGFATHCLNIKNYERALVEITKIPWSGQVEEDKEKIKDLLEALSHHDSVKDWQKQLNHLQELEASTRLEDFVSKLESLAADDKFWFKVNELFQKASPTSRSFSWELIERSKNWSREHATLIDESLALYFSRHPDFYEGVRALLIDKDQSPKWHAGKAPSFDWNPLQDSRLKELF